MNAKTATLLVAILGTVATVVGAVVEVLPIQWAVLTEAIIAGLYAIVRGLQKIADGATIKSLFSTTETWGVVLAMLAPILLAIGGFMSPASAAWIAGIAAAMLKVSRVLQAKASKSNDRGHSTPTMMFLMLTVCLAVMFVYVSKSRADEPVPQIGTCITPTICVQPAVAITAFQLNLKTWDYERVALAVGYGFTYKTETINLGAAIYGGVGISNTSPNAPQASILFNVADVLAFGPGVQVFKGADGDLIWQGLFTVAANYNVGGSSDYLSKVFRSARLHTMSECEVSP